MQSTDSAAWIRDCRRVPGDNREGGGGAGDIDCGAGNFNMVAVAPAGQVGDVNHAIGFGNN